MQAGLFQQLTLPGGQLLGAALELRLQRRSRLFRLREHLFAFAQRLAVRLQALLQLGELGGPRFQQGGAFGLLGGAGVQFLGLLAQPGLIGG